MDRRQKVRQVINQLREEWYESRRINRDTARVIMPAFVRNPRLNLEAAEAEAVEILGRENFEWLVNQEMLLA